MTFFSFLDGVGVALVLFILVGPVIYLTFYFIFRYPYVAARDRREALEEAFEQKKREDESHPASASGPT